MNDYAYDVKEKNINLGFFFLCMCVGGVFTCAGVELKISYSINCFSTLFLKTL